MLNILYSSHQFSQSLGENMTSNTSHNSTQIIVWSMTLMLFLSILPFSSADESTDEWFEGYDYGTSDRDDDDYEDLITIEFNPDTNSSNDVTIHVQIDVSNSSGEQVSEITETYSIENSTDYWFEIGWDLDFCTNTCSADSFDFEVNLYDDDWYLEDSFSIYDVYLSEFEDTNYWFNSSSYDVYDNDENYVNDTIEITYDPDVGCDCEKEIIVEIGVVNSGTDEWDEWLTFYYEINGTNSDSFSETWSPDEVGPYNYTFEVRLFDNDWNFRDEFTIVNISLECYEDCNLEHWFNSSSYAVYDNDENYVNDTIEIFYDPDVDCDCEKEIIVEIQVINSDTDEWDESLTFYYEINGTNSDSFSETWSPDEVGPYNYTFEVLLFDNDWDFRDEFTIEDVSLECYEDCNVEHWFNSSSYYVYDDDDDNVNDTIEIFYDPDVGCDCEKEVIVEIEVINSDTDEWQEGLTFYHEIYGNNSDSFSQTWSPNEAGPHNYTFEVRLFDNDWDFKDEFTIEDVSLECYENCEEHEWFDSSWFYELSDSNGDELDDTITIFYDPNTGCECEVEVHVKLEIQEDGDYKDEESADHTIYGDELDEFDQEWISWETGTYDFRLHMYDEDWNYEDEIWIYDIYLDTGDEIEHDEWFGNDPDWFTVDNETISIFYDPNTECDCEVKVWVYIDIEDNSGEKIDTIASSHYITADDNDMFFQSWYANEEGHYNFNIVLFDDEGNGPHYREDDYWIEDVFLGAGGEESTEFGHAAFVVDHHGDGFVNDLIAVVFHGEGEAFKQDAYFEIYDEDEEQVASGTPNEDGDRIFLASNLSAGWYILFIHLESGSESVHTSQFHSYGEDTEFEKRNSDLALVRDENEDGEFDYECSEEEPCNDAYFLVHQGDWTAGIEDISIDIDIYDEDQDEWTDYDTIFTNETGWAVSFDSPCGSYSWYVDGEGSNDGGYDVMSGCGQDDENLDEWIHAWIHYVPEDENGNSKWNEIVIGYDPETECDCNVTVDVYLEVYDENGDEAASSGATHTINGDQEDWFLQEISMNIEPGKYDFYIDMYDEDGIHEEHKEFTLIMSDEWLDYDLAVEDGNVKIDLQGNTNYNGGINTYYDFNVYRWNDTENDWEKIDEKFEDARISSESPAPIHFEWEADESGYYLFVVYMDDAMGQEDSIEFDFEIDIVSNQVPVIEDIFSPDQGLNNIYETQEFDLEASVYGLDGDSIYYEWDMGDGNVIIDETVRGYSYPDDGLYDVTLMVKDANHSINKTIKLKIRNSAPLIKEIMQPPLAQLVEGAELSFTAIVMDCPSDTVTIRWEFGDEFSVIKNFNTSFAQYRFLDDGEFNVTVYAEDEDGGLSKEYFQLIIRNLDPVINDKDLVVPTNIELGVAANFLVKALDAGNDTITYTFDFDDGTTILTSLTGNVTHKFAKGEAFNITICAKDEDGGEACRTKFIPVELLELLQESELPTPGFGIIGVTTAFGLIGILRRRTH